MVQEYEQRYSIRIYQRTEREDSTIRYEGGLKKMRGSENDTTPATTVVGIVRLSDSTIPSCCVTARARHCGTTALLFLRGSRIRIDVTPGEKTKQTLLYLRISRTRLMNASSTLIRCLAEVSMNLHPKCLARSRPSDATVRTRKM